MFHSTNVDLAVKCSVSHQVPSSVLYIVATSSSRTFDLIESIPNDELPRYALSLLSSLLLQDVRSDDEDSDEEPEPKEAAATKKTK